MTTKGPPKRLSGNEIAEQLSNLVMGADGKHYESYGQEHNWTHICGVWKLPYAKSLILMHNIDVMHQEKNMAESIIMTCMDFAGKSKDNAKARKDLAEICNRPTLHLNESGGKPHAPFAAGPKEKRKIMLWLKKLKFPDGFAAGFKRAPNMKTMKLTGLKSHDYHILMERLIPVMFRGFLPEDV